MQEAECADGGVYCEGGSAGRGDLLYTGKVPASAALLQGCWLSATAEHCKCHLCTGCVTLYYVELYRVSVCTV